MNKKFQNSEVIVRDATINDMIAVADMIQELANFEKMPDGPKLTVKDLQRDGFETQPPAFRCKVAELKSEVVGFALYFNTYSTWEGKALMLEDLYVRENFRRRGVGQMLFYNVAAEAAATGCTRLDFHVLAWNEARSFYEAMGAENLTASQEWCYYRLYGDALTSLSNQK
ncbi:unnamed protein product [Parnassius mnemosyne]|uniref:N-acetyltransferase domain-containing protein n=1 Tax=Parnassius mnemosyne TaxID=213953 RepID=A0AAV1LYF5_9NEOP